MTEHRTKKEIAEQFVDAIKLLAENKEGMEELTHYLTYHFDSFVRFAMRDFGTLADELTMYGTLGMKFEE